MLSGEQSTNFVYFGFDCLRVRTGGLGCLEVPVAPFPLVLSQCLLWRPVGVPLSGPLKEIFPKAITHCSSLAEFFHFSAV